SWRETLIKVKKTAEEEKEAKKAKDALKKRLKKMIDNTPEDFADPRRPLAMKKLEMEDEELEAAKKMVKEGKDEMRIPLNLMREAVKLGMSLGGKNVSDFDNKTLKLVSPRFMSVVEDDAEDGDTINLLSPSLFSLHEDGKGLEALTSLPAILKKLKNNDQEAWMDFIIEASGVSDAVDKATEQRKKNKDKEMRGSNGEPLYFTKQNVTDNLGYEEAKKVEVFETLDKTYSEEQRKELDTRGYLFMRPDQVEILYGKDSAYHDEALYERYMNMTKTIPEHEKHEILENDIHFLSEMNSFKLHRRSHNSRSKRGAPIINSPVLFTPLVEASAALSNTWIVQSPIVFSPIVLSPAALGPIILSPWVFVPLILSPRVLSPLIVNPLIFSPIVLSPLVLHPLILVPGIFNPIILSPLVLSPFILSPQVFTPLILSPFVLNPLILTPMVGSPLILSPFVLSPIILSPQALFAVVLSPYALSPLIESKLIASEVVLSPSWLS
ncbi:mlt-10, partial [Pristionchus pacificus]